MRSVSQPRFLGAIELLGEPEELEYFFEKKTQEKNHFENLLIELTKNYIKLLTRSKPRHNNKKRVHCKFNCINVNFDQSQPGVFTIHNFIIFAENDFVCASLQKAAS